MSQQGKAYTPEQREMIIESLKPYLELGFSRKRACELIGFDNTTLSKWTVNDAGLSTKLTGWENALTGLALANIGRAIREEAEDKTKADNSWKWAEKKLDELKDKKGIELTATVENINPEDKKVIDNAIDGIIKPN
jgi:hypothetical protein